MSVRRRPERARRVLGVSGLVHPSVIIIEPDDVVLSKVVPMLDFDEDKVVFSLILDSVGDTSGDVDGGTR